MRGPDWRERARVPFNAARAPFAAIRATCFNLRFGWEIFSTHEPAMDLRKMRDNSLRD
jgi:hypothetical protein